jgi:hypothetical protein
MINKVWGVSGFRSRAAWIAYLDAEDDGYYALSVGLYHDGRGQGCGFELARAWS